MDNATLLEAQLQVKKMQTLLNEVLDLTDQIARASDREDRVSLQMLLELRADPIEKLRSIRAVLLEQRNSLPEQKGARLAELLNGQPAARPEEAALAAQVKETNQLLSRVVDGDRRISQKLIGEDSIYT